MPYMGGRSSLPAWRRSRSCGTPDILGATCSSRGRTLNLQMNRRFRPIYQPMTTLDSVENVSVAAPSTAASQRPGHRRTARAGADVELTVMSYNVLFGRRWGPALDLIRAHPADIICLQEVPQESHRCGGAAPSRIIRDLDMAGEFAPLWYGPPNAIGNMTLVRGRIERGDVLKVPLSRSYAIVNDVHVKGVRLTVANLHLTPMLGPPPLMFPFSEIFRVREVMDLTRRLCHHDRPVIAAGDFNTFWPAPACYVMGRHWTDARRSVPGRYLATRPTYGLPFVIDHIMVRGDVDVLDYDVIDGPASDHRAVLARIRVPRHAPKS